MIFNLLSLSLCLSLVASLLAGLPFAILNVRHRPFRRGFFCRDESIKYPFKEDTISYQLLGGVMVPVVILTVSAPLLSALTPNCMWLWAFKGPFLVNDGILRL